MFERTNLLQKWCVLLRWHRWPTPACAHLLFSWVSDVVSIPTTYTPCPLLAGPGLELGVHVQQVEDHGILSWSGLFAKVPEIRFLLQFGT